jgi:hypothetical protein
VKRCAVLLLFLLCIPVPAQAQGLDSGAPLTRAELDKFLVDFPPTAKYMESLGRQLETLNGPQAQAQSRADQEYRAFVGKRGWTAERFSQVAARVSSGIVALQMAEMGPQIQAEYDKARAQILAEPGLTPEQKRQMLAQMEQGLAQSRAAGQAVKLTPGEATLIRANKDRIIQAFDLQ